MDDFLFIERENMPCIYQLSWDEKTPAIVLKIHRDFAGKHSIPSNSPFVCDFLKYFGFMGFVGDFFGETFGFDSAFSFYRNENTFVIFKAPIPVAKKTLYEICPLCSGDKKGLFGRCQKCEGKGKLHKKCNHCGGSGREDEVMDCLFCEGKGIETYVDWRALSALSASFTVFFEFVSIYLLKSEVVSSSIPQLLLVNTSTGKMNNSIGGTYSIPLTKWLLLLGSVEMPEVKQAMMVSWKRMWGKVGEFEKHEFRAEIFHGAGRLSLSCPGDRCDLYVPCNYGPKFGEGCRFCDHNVDTPAQVIAFLSGLASLCDKARKEIKF